MGEYCNQQWRVDFQLNWLRLSEEQTLYLDDDKLHLRPVNDHVEGEIFVVIQNDKIDEYKPLNYAKRKLDVVFGDMHSIVTGSGYIDIQYNGTHLLNEEDIEEEVKVGRTSIGMGVATVGQLRMDGLRESISFLDAVGDHEQSERLWRVIEWYRKGRNEDDYISRFIAYWIAFNGLFSFYDSGRGDRRALNDFLNEYPVEQNAEEIVTRHDDFIQQLSEMNLQGYHRGRNYSQALKDILEGSPSNHAILIKVSQCLRIIRNNIFHGGTEQDELQFINKASALLKDILRYSIKDFTYC